MTSPAFEGSLHVCFDGESDTEAALESIRWGVAVWDPLLPG